MGITNNCARFLFYSHQKNVSFTDTIMLGRQQLYAEVGLIRQLLKENNLDANFEVDNSNKYAEPLFKVLGAQKIDSIDFSDYESATLIHDLNTPVPDKLRNKYSLVFDGGTLEHVFNFPIAITNCMNMLKVGGHFISITPTNNQCGHGFYQFSPELYFSLLTESRGFLVKSILLAVDIPGKGINEWFEIENPSIVKTRVTLSNSYPTYLLILAEKIKETPIDQEVPYQSDYRNVWQSFDMSKHETTTAIRKVYKFLMPKPIREMIYKIRSKKSINQNVSGLGNVNAEYFKKIEIK